MESAPPSLQEQKRNFTRTRLVEAAKEVFAVKGYLATTVDDIAVAAGASRATFYLHFSSKDRIAAAMLSDSERFGVERYLVLDELLGSSSPGREVRLRAWLEDWLRYWRADAGLNHALAGAMHVDPEIERQSLDSGASFIDSLVGVFERLPPEQREPTRARLLMLETMTRSVFALASRNLLEVSDDTILSYLTDSWVALLIA